MRVMFSAGITTGGDWLNIAGLANHCFNSHTSGVIWMLLWRLGTAQ